AADNASIRTAGTNQLGRLMGAPPLGHAESGTGVRETHPFSDRGRGCRAAWGEFRAFPGPLILPGGAVAWAPRCREATLRLPITTSIPWGRIVLPVRLLQGTFADGRLH